MWRRVLPYLRRYKGRLAFGFTALVLCRVFYLIVPQVLERAVDALEAGATSEMWTYGGFIVAAAGGSAVFRYFMRWYLIGVSRFAEYDLRRDFYLHLQRLPAAFYARFRVGDILSRGAQDMNAVRMVLGPGLMYPVETVFTTVGCFAFMLAISPRLTLVALAVMPVVSILMKILGEKIFRRSEVVQAKMADISAVVQENAAAARLVRAFVQEDTIVVDNADYVRGQFFFLADPQTAFEAALGATTLPLAREINSATFLPSSRSIAFRKSAASDIGGYPAWLDFCEDLVFDLRLRERSGPFAFAPDAIVYFRPRPGLRQFFRQYYLYARGDGKANLWLKRHLIRYLTYFALTPGIFITGALWHPALWLLYLLGAADYLYQPYRRLPSVMRRAPDQSRSVWLYCIVMIPLIRLTGDMAKMIGYPVGWRWRLAQRPPDWRR